MIPLAYAMTRLDIATCRMPAVLRPYKFFPYFITIVSVCYLLHRKFLTLILLITDSFLQSIHSNHESYTHINQTKYKGSYLPFYIPYEIAKLPQAETIACLSGEYECVDFPEVDIRLRWSGVPK